MKKMLLLGVILFLMPQASGQNDDEASLRAFIDEFFTEFAALTATARDSRDNRDQSRAMPVINHTLAHFVRSTETGEAARGSVPEVELVAKLTFHGPASWDISNVRVAGDVARADVQFHSVQESHTKPIPFAFRFIRANDGWRFLRATDKRPKEEAAEPEVDVAGAVSSSQTLSAAATLAQYLDFLVANRGAVDIRNPAAIRPAMKTIGDEIAVLWADGAPARRARNEATTKLLLQDIKAWEIVEDSDADNEWRAAIEVTMGERNPMAAFSKIKPRMTFVATLQNGIWKLSGFELR